MKKVLMIAYFFPPLGGVGVQRTLKFTKYLPSFGWAPTVLSVKNPDPGYFDYDLTKEIPSEVKVIRTYSSDPTKLFKLLRSCYDSLFSFFNLKRKGTTNLHKMKNQSLALKLNNFIFIPDNKIVWWPFAFFKILQIFKKNNFDLIYSTSPVFTSHLIGMAAKYVFKKPWVVDLRDLWVLHPYIRPATKLHSDISRSIESKTFKLADKIVTVADELRDDLIENYPEIPEEKFVVIPNGYDQADFKIRVEQKDNRFSIGHIGSLYVLSGRSPHYFLVALSELIRQFPQLENQIEVTFLGPMDRQSTKIFQALVSKYHLKSVVRQMGPVSHREAVKYMRSCDLLLLIAGKKSEERKSNDDHPYERSPITGKIFEYLASGNYILALDGDGPVKRLITETNSGYVVDPEDIQGIKKAILSCYKLYTEGKLKIQPKKEVLTRFERKRLTGELAEIFDELIGRKR